jgi:hypothetical protein
MTIELDHIVIGAATLEDGVRFVQDRLGVEIGPGGKHPLMGTHNRLMRLGEGSFLEVIAIDPEAPRPARPRWFALDDPAQQQRLAESPRLVAWVARTSDIDAAAKASPVPLGEVIPVTRGSLSWRLSVPEDGRPPMDGVAPHLIQWDAGLRPWETMTDCGCRLEEFTLGHPEADRLSRVLGALRLDSVERLAVRDLPSPRLSAAIETPVGIMYI